MARQNSAAMQKGRKQGQGSEMETSGPWNHFGSARSGGLSTHSSRASTAALELLLTTPAAEARRARRARGATSLAGAHAAVPRKHVVVDEHVALLELEGDGVAPDRAADVAQHVVRDRRAVAVLALRRDPKASAQSSRAPSLSLARAACCRSRSGRRRNRGARRSTSSGARAAAPRRSPRPSSGACGTASRRRTSSRASRRGPTPTCSRPQPRAPPRPRPWSARSAAATPSRTSEPPACSADV